MLIGKWKAVALCFAFVFPALETTHAIGGNKRPFSVADDIALTDFGDEEHTIQFAPNGKYFAVWSERGQLDTNQVEDSIRFYGTREVEVWLAGPTGVKAPSPEWAFSRSAKEGSSINAWRWLADSSGISFAEPIGDGHQRLIIASLRKKTFDLLTAPPEPVGSFDIRDRNHYIYTSDTRSEVSKLEADRQKVAFAGTGYSLFHLLSPRQNQGVFAPQAYLHAVVDGKHFELKGEGEPVVLLLRGDPVLSPDGSSFVGRLSVSEIPVSWETLYPSPYSSFFNIRTTDSARPAGAGLPVSEFVRVNLKTRAVEPLTEAPDSYSVGWASSTASWSHDGQAILLPGTFLKSKDARPSQPCVAVVDLKSHTSDCVETLKSPNDAEYHLIKNAWFIGGDKQRVMVSFYGKADHHYGITEYRLDPNGSWKMVPRSEGELDKAQDVLQVTVQEGLNDSPQLIAGNKQGSRVLWNPNTQLENVEIGRATVYRWKDKEGHDWRGGLYWPTNYVPGHTYPLVIQTHGFVDELFVPSGALSTAFAARELAAAGMVVLQVDENCPSGTKLSTNEGPCNVGGFESGAKQLISEGLVDPDRIGIIGFSRTCFYVMEALTAGSIHLKAASIADGVMENYLQYITMVDWLDNGIENEADSIIGAQPFGKGLSRWVEGSPDFNLDKVDTPLLVSTGEGSTGILFMWGPYAGLRLLKKPVDLMIVNTREHVLTNPAARLASQGGSVDWFRFWLQGKEGQPPAWDPDRYERWRGLKKLQEDNDKKAAEAKREEEYYSVDGVAPRL